MRMNITKVLKSVYKIQDLHVIILLACICVGVLFYIAFILNNIEGFESNADNFHKDIRVGNKLVWFYAPWCGHCKTMHKDWDKASLLVNRNRETHMVKVNVGDKENKKHQQISDEFNIKGFPTILGLNMGQKVSEYNGDRTSDAFVAHVKSTH